jgi:hypothetical protein
MRPAGGFPYQGIPGLNVTDLPQQATSFVYTSFHSVPVASFTFNQCSAISWGPDWYVKSSDATWTASKLHNATTAIPHSAGLGRVRTIPDRSSIDTSVSRERTVCRQFSSQTAQFTLNFQVTLLFPAVDL